MPRLVKGGKWVYGWSWVSPKDIIRIPPDAFVEYEFQPGEMVLVFRGSRNSGGFSLGRLEKLENSLLRTHSIGQTRIGTDGLVTLLPEIEIRPDARLLVVRGSGLALGFIQCGSIYKEALKHPEIEIFMVDEDGHNTMSDR
jgi:hypothetical protein